MLRGLQQAARGFGGGPHAAAGLIDLLRDALDLPGQRGAGFALLTRRRRHLAHQPLGRTRAFGDLLQQAARFSGRNRHPLRLGQGGVHDLRRVERFALDALDHPGNLDRRLLGALGKHAHLVGHHRETAPLFAGPRCLDGGVERQKVGLPGDLLDRRRRVRHGLNVGGQRPDTLGRASHGARHGVDVGRHRPHALFALQGVAGSAVGDRLGLAGIGRHVVDRHRQLFHRRGHGLRRFRFLRGGLSDRGRGLFDVVGRGGDVARAGSDFADHRAQAVDQPIEFAEQAAGRRLAQAERQVTARHLAHGRDRLFGLAPDLGQDAARHEPGDTADEQRRRQNQQRNLAQRGGKMRLDVLDVKSGADHPIPLGEMPDMVDFRNLNRPARLDGERPGVAGLVERRPDKVADGVIPFLVFAFPVTHALVLAPDGVHHPHALAVIDVVVLVGEKAHVAQRVTRAFLRLFATQRTLRLKFLERFGGRNRQIDRRDERLLAIIHHLRAQMKGLDRPQQREPGQRRKHQDAKAEFQTARIDSERHIPSL